ncbi:ELF3-like protein 2 [Coffea arabica]|uniref:ELF3-like protein 2 n=1 Tax=Coffea arabica TaxID=13443 RepID=A0A6P6XF35_COFAR|nr:protein EARLY FLOWERING 3-like [Coffea arabica]XP_027126375.1 protein EARLY FLOWERING 3-like [Coffea arabica]
MRGGKDEKKQMDPLFPRLHINDAEGIGPRAPPRNKMALCEQVNAPSQRFSSGSMSLRTLSSRTRTNSDASPLLNHVSLFCSSPKCSHMAERLKSNSSAGMSLNTKYSELQILSSGNFQSFSARKPLKMTAEYTLFRPCDFFNSITSFAKKDGNKDDIRIPYSDQREKTFNCSSVGFKMQKEKVSSSSLGFSGKPESTFERQEMEMGINDAKSREHPRNQAEVSFKVSEVSDGNFEKLPDQFTEENILVDTAPSVVAVYGTCGSGRRAVAPINHAKTNDLVNDISTSHITCAQAHQECRNLPIGTDIDDNISKNPERHSRKRSFSSQESLSCSSPPTAENNRIPKRLESVNERPKGNHCASRVGNDARHIAISDNSVMDSKSGLHVSPDDVVGMIGPKFFWSARRTIAHQQRIFALQIFELHRLIKVQRLIAGSPEMFFEDSVIFTKPSIDRSPEKKFQLQNFPELPSLFLKPKVDALNPKPCLDHVAEEAHGKLPPPAYETENRYDTPKSPLKPYSGVTPMTFAIEAKFGPWCFPAPPGNQWLIPVKSPSEGLVYKPYAGPCPPTLGCIAPIYGGCGTMCLTRMDAEHVNCTAYGIPASLGRSCCFQPHALPVMNTENSSSAAEQTSPFVTGRSSRPDNHRVATYDINYIIPYRSLDAITSHRTGIMTDSTRIMQVSKSCSDFPGSTASNLNERVQADELSLFPMTPTLQRSKHPIQNNNNEQQIQVIKVVPYNPKSASESAARIFQSIQEEKKQQE